MAIMEMNDLRDLIIDICGLLRSHYCLGATSLTKEIEEKRRELCEKISSGKIFEYISNTNPLELSLEQRWLLSTALLAHKDACLPWLHYNSMKMLDGINFPAKEMWQMFHAHSIVADIELVPQAGPLAYLTLAKATLEASPFQSCQMIYKALEAGLSLDDATPIVNKLVEYELRQHLANTGDIIKSPNERMAIGCKLLGAKQPNIFKELTRISNSEKQGTQLLEADRCVPNFVASFPINHYAYRHLRAALDSRALDRKTNIYCIEEGIVSIERKVDKSVSLYIFDSEGRWIADLSHGVLPFITNTPTRVDGIGLGVGCARPSDENKKKCLDSNSRLLSHCTAWDSGREQAFQQQ